MNRAVTRLIFTIVVALISNRVAAEALEYDYDADFMFDPSTGLYWRVESVPALTMTPADGGRIASINDVNNLFGEFGVIGGKLQPAVDTLMSFLGSDTPIPTRTASDESVNGWFSDIPPGTFNEYSFFYSGSSVSSSDWKFTTNATLGAYLPGDPFMCGNTACTSSSTVQAYVDSSTPFVPLPPSVWLLLSGLAALGVVVRKGGIAPAE